MQRFSRDFIYLFKARLKALTNVLKVNNSVITIQWHLSPLSSNWQLVNQSADRQQLKRGGTLHPLTCTRHGRSQRADLSLTQDRDWDTSGNKGLSGTPCLPVLRTTYFFIFLVWFDTNMNVQKCARCGFVVYPAEKINLIGQVSLWRVSQRSHKWKMIKSG